MSTKAKQFSFFGRVYRTRQFAAVPALAIMEKKGDIHPTEMLRQTEVHSGTEWVALSTNEAINDYVFDGANALLPLMVLKALTGIVNEFNFGFLMDWKGVKVPTRFIDPVQTSVAASVDPLIAQLVGDGVSDLQKLEEYYSLEDAFKMFDIIVARGVNQALSNEAAMKASKTR